LRAFNAAAAALAPAFLTGAEKQSFSVEALKAQC
jgi:hypothetical protein